MEFSSEAQKACYERIQPMMKELFGEFAMTNANLPQFGIRVGSALVTVTVYPWGDNDAVLQVHAWVVTNVEMTPDLMHFLLQENNQMRFGAFGLDKEDDIYFEHTIVGSTCDKQELRASVMAVLNIADEYDDKIVAKWGGQRALDR